MNNIPKFRIWDQQNKEWATDFTLSLNGEILCDGGSTLFIRDNFVLMQFTGLTDKDGKEIFEGDILRRDDYYADIMKVDFHAGMYGWWETFCADKDFTVIAGWDPEKRLQVMGNIYEHSELLEVKG